MQQYQEMKKKHPDAILLFRIGDFYEIFGEDAVKASEILGITLTRRANGSDKYIELAGFPHHALDTYLPKLVRAGQRVAICEQLEDPKLTKTSKQKVVEIVTPNTQQVATEEPVKTEVKEIETDGGLDYSDNPDPRLFAYNLFGNWSQGTRQNASVLLCQRKRRRKSRSKSRNRGLTPERCRQINSDRSLIRSWNFTVL